MERWRVRVRAVRTSLLPHTTHRTSHLNGHAGRRPIPQSAQGKGGCPMGATATEKRVRNRSTAYSRGSVLAALRRVPHPGELTHESDKDSYTNAILGIS